MEPWDKTFLLKVIQTRMPFGRYEGMLLIDLPEPYVVWFSRNGFPDGELGRMLGLVYEIKLNGLEYLFKASQGAEPKPQQRSSSSAEKP